MQEKLEECREMQFLPRNVSPFSCSSFSTRSLLPSIGMLRHMPRNHKIVGRNSDKGLQGAEMSLNKLVKRNEWMTV